MTQTVMRCPNCQQRFEVPGDQRAPAACPACEEVVPLPPETPPPAERTPLTPPSPNALQRRPRGMGSVLALGGLLLVAAVMVTAIVRGPGGPPGHSRPPTESRQKPPPPAFSRADWCKRLASHAMVPDPAVRTVQGVDRAAFEDLMGAPARVEMHDTHTVWCYVCDDGEIHLILDAGKLYRTGQIHGEIVETGPSEDPKAANRAG